jgi:hypothetical protein
MHKPQTAKGYRGHLARPNCRKCHSLATRSNLCKKNRRVRHSWRGAGACSFGPKKALPFALIASPDSRRMGQRHWSGFITSKKTLVTGASPSSSPWHTGLVQHSGCTQPLRKIHRTFEGLPEHCVGVLQHAWLQRVLRQQRKQQPS